MSSMVFEGDPCAPDGSVRIYVVEGDQRQELPQIALDGRPQGHQWGYESNNTLNTAYTILQYAAGEQIARELAAQFQKSVIAPQVWGEALRLPAEDVLRWVAERRS